MKRCSYCGRENADEAVFCRECGTEFELPAKPSAPLPERPEDPPAEEIRQLLPELEEAQLCLSCLAPNDPAAHFCVKCGAPLSSYASTGPFESLFAEGAVYRQATERPRSLIVVFGIWLIFGTLTVGGIVVVFCGKDLGFFPALFGASVATFSMVMVWKTTWNYLTRKKVIEKTEG